MPIDLTLDQKFDALKMRYQDHVELLREMTRIEIRIFSGFIALQLALGSWIPVHPPKNALSSVGILLIDGVLTFISFALLRYNFFRRKEAIGTLKNVMEALGYYE